MNKYTEIKVEGYERVVKCENEKLNMIAYISVHNTKLGPSLGGCRFWNYDCQENALIDCLRLSKAMTYKSCMAKLKQGGGKSTILMNDFNKNRKEEVMEAIGEFVEYLGGSYIIAEDVNVTTSDLIPVRRKTKYVVREILGDPSPVTAKGVYYAMKATVEYLSGNSSLEGLKILVMGVGAVGGNLVDLLAEEKANIIICDINNNNINKVLNKHKNIIVVNPSECYKYKCDIFSPCALGGVLNKETINMLNTRAVVGAANNQLESRKCGYYLLERKILYAPDYVANAGGVMQVSGLFGNSYSPEKVDKYMKETIVNNLKNIYGVSEQTNMPTNKVANKMVEKMLDL